MSKIISTFILILTFYIEPSYAALIVTPLDLKCGVYISNYDGIEHYSTSSNVSLIGKKKDIEGSTLIGENEKYEFWVFTNGVMSRGTAYLITSFQVAIKVKATDEFFHAVSDTSYDPMVLPKQARISLIKYFDNTFQEEGSLFFECLSLKFLD